MKGVALDALDLYPVRLRMRHRFRGLEFRESILIRGPGGWGEFSPFSEYPPSVAARWLASGLESACSAMGPTRRRVIPINVTVPAVGPDVAHRIVVASGASTAKVKVAEFNEGESDDIARLEAVREALGEQGKIRIDANAAWDLDTAIARINRYASVGLEYVEQPVATIEDMARVRQQVDTPIAADESVRLAADPMQVVEAGAADLLVLKVQPMGGVARTLDLAERAGLPVVISSALETSVGMAAGVRAAASLAELPYACGLGTVSLLADDVVHERLEPDGGKMVVRTVEPDLELLERFRPDPGRTAEMLRRLRDAAELLT